MTIVSGIATNLIGSLTFLCSPYPRLQFQNQRYGSSVDCNPIQLATKRITNARIKYFHEEIPVSNHILSVGRNHYQLHYKDDSPGHSFWLNLMKETLWVLKSMFLFLVEQPSQLKYIEWPSVQSTLKTATLTLVLVALLIVALCSVDAALCYILNVLLRTPA